MNYNISALYFSPTSTTAKIVKTIASGLCESYKEYNLTLPNKREEYQGLTFANEDIVVIGVPVYRGRIPE